MKADGLQDAPIEMPELKDKESCDSIAFVKTNGDVGMLLIFSYYKFMKNLFLTSKTEWIYKDLVELWMLIHYTVKKIYLIFLLLIESSRWVTLKKV